VTNVTLTTSASRAEGDEARDPLCDLCELRVSVVDLPGETLTTETLRTQRPHRERQVTYFSDTLAGAQAQGANGHHGIDVSHGTENLVTQFDVQTRFVHDVSVEWYALHTVFANGRGVDLNMDHHREANYSSLFSNLDCGAGTRPFNSGGSGNRGAHSGAYSTFWNIRAAGPLRLPPRDFGPLLNFIGLELFESDNKDLFQTKAKDPASPYQWLIDPLVRAPVCPNELYQAMRARRLHRSKLK